jgi:GTP cyclohydrolase I
MDYYAATAAAGLLLQELGIDCTGELGDTPHRMVRALTEMTSSLRDGFDPGVHLTRQFEAPPGGVPQLIVMKDITFTSVCEHHLLPFTGQATVGYLPAPDAKVVGASKIPRLVTGLAAKPQMQERLGQEVVDALGKHLDIQGAACTIRGAHSCMTLRGPRATGASMITNHLTGCFLDGQVRAEFLALSRP